MTDAFANGAYGWVREEVCGGRADNRVDSRVEVDVVVAIDGGAGCQNASRMYAVKVRREPDGIDARSPWQV